MLIIFDCDGVLIDSEIISSESVASVLSAEGLEISAREVTMRFAGLPQGSMETILAEESGFRFTGAVRDRIQAEFDERIAAVTAIPGIAALLDDLDGPRCVCSNSRSDYLKKTLSSTGLYDRFKPYVFAAGEVGNGRGKPDPNVFLHAAREFAVAPRAAVVVEDSVAGITAATAAGMRTIGFTGGAHAWPGLADALTEAGAETVVRRAQDVAAVVAAYAGWDGMEG